MKKKIARKAYLAIVSLNVLHQAKRLKRTYDKNPQKVKDVWANYGDWEDLRKAMEKGSKQTVKGHGVGVIVTAAMLGLALAIIKHFGDLFKKEGTEGDEKEIKDVENGEAQGEDALLNDRSIPKGTADMPEGKDYGYLHPKGEKGEKETTDLSFASPLGFCFKTLLLIPLMQISNPILFFIASLISSYCVIGFLFAYPLMQFNFLNLGYLGEKYFSPLSWIKTKLTNIFSHGKKG